MSIKEGRSNENPAARNARRIRAALEVISSSTRFDVVEMFPAYPNQGDSDFVQVDIEAYISEPDGAEQ
jgi:hypothetical protein